MTDLDAFLPLIRQFAPGVADPTAFGFIREAAITFCERTRLWRYEYDEDITGQDDLFAPSGATIFEIETVRFNNEPLDKATPQHLDEVLPTWRTDTGLANVPRYITQLAPDTLRLVPQASGHINLYLTLKPAEDADTLPDFLAQKYRKAIADGALSHILMIPNQSFTNPDLAGYFATLFQQRLDSLSTIGAVGQMRAKPRVRGQFF